MNVYVTPQQKRSLEKMMKKRYKVKDKFYDLKKYVPELLNEVIDEWEKE
jgi:3-methyladenine DNA glycosylase AlkC|tara:strand:+ start:174 stop:320 length:147 start_codon:yes stop_codon:yes gene_type:complete